MSQYGQHLQPLSVQGTGLGLLLRYDIITKGHGGMIEVKTEVGVGTEFIILIPVVN